MMHPGVSSRGFRQALTMGMVKYMGSTDHSPAMERLRDYKIGTGIVKCALLNTLEF